MSPLVLAYLGDTVYESYIREHLIRVHLATEITDSRSLKVATGHFRNN